MSNLRASRGLGDVDARPLLGNMNLMPGEALNEDPEDRVLLDSDEESVMSGSDVNDDNEVEDEDALDNPAFRKPTHMGLVVSAAMFARFGKRKDRARPRNLRKFKSLGIFSGDNPIRLLCHWWVTSTHYTLLMTIIVLINSLCLAWFDPVNPDSPTNVTITWINLTCTILYITEAVAKIIAYGLVLHEGAYLRKFWNHVDLFVMITGIFELVYPNGGVGTNVTRAFRAFRPIRLVRFIRPVKRLATAIMKAGPYILNVGLLLLVFYLIFGLAGVETFGDFFRFHCVDPNNLDAPIEEDTCGRPRDPMWPQLADWMGGRSCPKNLTCEFTNSNPSHNGTSFDTFPRAVLTIFQCVTLEGWTPVSYWAMNSTGDISVIYFILLPLLGAFFFMNLFLGAIQAVYGTIPKHSTDTSRRETEPLSKHPTVVKSKELLSHIGEFLKRPEPGTPAFETSFYLRRAHWLKSQVVDTRGWYWLQMTTTLVFIAIMASYHDNMAPGFETFLRVADYILSTVFTIELAVELFALGLYDFFKYIPNYIDVVVVIFSWGALASGDGGWVVLRVLRVIRLARLSGTWKRLHKLAQVVTGSAANLLWTLLLMIIVLYMFTILGMEIFGGKMNFPEGLPRYNFDSFWSALVSVFSILGVENWHQNTLYNCIRAMDSAWAALFPVAILVIPNYIILNLFLSVFLDEFKEIAEMERQDQQEKMEEAIEFPSPASGAVDAKIGLSSSSNAEEGIQMTAMGSRAVTQVLDSMGLPKEAPVDNSKRKRYRLHGDSLFLFGPESPIRIKLADFITHIGMRVFITSIIIINCLALAIEKSPAITNTNPALFALLFKWLDVCFLILYAIEAAIKIIASGVIYHPGAYFRVPWHILEFAAVIALSVVVGLGSGCPEWVRGFLAVIPLRLLSRFKRTRLILATLSRAIPALQSVLPVALFVWTIFAIFGVHLFGSRMGSCNDESIINRVNCVGFYNVTDPETGEITDKKLRQWTDPDNNFNNIIQALFSIFKMSTGEGWPETMTNVMDITDINKRPERDASSRNAIYFMAFVPLCLWFVLGLVVGTVIDAFDEIRSSAVEVDRGPTGSDATENDEDDAEFIGLNQSHKVDLLLTQQQKRWVQLQQVMVATSARVAAPPPEGNRVRMFLFNLISRKAFDYVSLLIVAGNALLLAFNTNIPTQEMYWIQYWGDRVFTALYIIEIIIRLIPLGWYFFSDGWNLLDLSTTVMSVVGWFVAVYNLELASLIRIFKVLRVLKMTKLTKRQRVMFKTIVMSIPTMFNAILVFVVLLFSFTVVSTHLFGHLTPARELTGRANFKTFGDALYLAYRMSTGENWDTIMHDVMNQTSDWAALYFIVFTVAVTFLMANLFVAIVLDNFSFVTSIEEGDVTLDDVQRFRTVWREFDKKNLGVISVDDLPRFLRNLRPPLGLGLDASKLEALRVAAELDVPVYNKRIKFSDLLLHLSKRAIGIDHVPQKIVQEAVKRIALRWYNRHAGADTLSLADPDSGQQADGEARAVLAASIIQRAWRSFRQRNPKPVSEDEDDLSSSSEQQPIIPK